MKIIKRTISLVLTLCMLLSICAFAANADVTITPPQVTIAGTGLLANESYNIAVYAPGFSGANTNGTNIFSALLYTGEVTADATGNYTLSFNIPSNTTHGRCNYVIQNSKQKVEDSFYYMQQTDLNAVCAAFNGILSNGDYESLLNQYSVDEATFGKVLNITVDTRYTENKAVLNPYIYDVRNTINNGEGFKTLKEIENAYNALDEYFFLHQVNNVANSAEIVNLFDANMSVFGIENDAFYASNKTNIAGFFLGIKSAYGMVMSYDAAKEYFTKCCLVLKVNAASDGNSVNTLITANADLLGIDASLYNARKTETGVELCGKNYSSYADFDAAFSDAVYITPKTDFSEYKEVYAGTTHTTGIYEESNSLLYQHLSGDYVVALTAQVSKSLKAAHNTLSVFNGKEQVKLLAYPTQRGFGYNIYKNDVFSTGHFVGSELASEVTNNWTVFTDKISNVNFLDGTDLAKKYDIYIEKTGNTKTFAIKEHGTQRYEYYLKTNIAENNDESIGITTFTSMWTLTDISIREKQELSSDIDHITSGNSVTATLNIKRFSSSVPENMLFITGAYKVSNSATVLTDIKTSPIVGLKIGNELSNLPTNTVNLPVLGNGEYCKIRSFLWDSVDGMHPLVNPFTTVKSNGNTKTDLISTPKNIRLETNGDGKFKILAIGDIQENVNNPVSAEAISEIKSMIDVENPDLVVMVGDNTDNPTTDTDKLHTYLQSCVSYIEEKNIPWAHVFGNHDYTNNMIMENVYEGFDKCISKGNTDLSHGITNYTLPVYSSGTGEPIFMLWALDTGNENDVNLPGYGKFSADQVSWYDTESQRINAYYGKQIPGFMFFHIPFTEMGNLTTENGYYDGTNEYGTEGYSLEGLSSIENDNGMWNKIVERGEVKAVVNGHQHIRNFAGVMNDIILSFSGKIGDSVYSRTETRGARIFEIDENNKDANGMASITTRFVNE